MAECFLVKRLGPVLTPADNDAKELLDKLPVGQSIRCKITRVRNLKFHNKYMAMVRFAYDYFEAPELPDPKYAKYAPEKNFDAFRKELIVRAGYYVATYKIDGSVRIDAQSMAIENMSAEEFDKLYDATLQVILNQLCTKLSQQEVENAIEGILNFAS